MTYILLLMSVFIIPCIATESDNCRSVIFTGEIEGKYLKGHGLRSIKTENCEQCQIQCYIEEECVSYNCGDQTCDLNSSDHIFHPDDLVEDEGKIYQATRNACKDNKCPSNTTCLNGFSDKGYKCRCPAGFTGKNCDKVIVHGGWSSWGNWSLCSAQCKEQGTKTRYRNCTNPTPENGGDPCHGSNVSTIQCSLVQLGCSARTTDGRCCVFPFIYQGTSYQSCTIVNSKTPWCATVPNADLDQQWGDCFGYVHVKVRSWGKDDPGIPKTSGIYINGIDHCRKKRGHNIASINPNGSIHSTVAFDTYWDPAAGIKMSDYINSLPNGTTVVVAVHDSAERHYQDALPALRSIGAKEPIVLSFRSAWYLVGYKGEHKPWITQDFKGRFNGPAEANMTISLC